MRQRAYVAGILGGVAALLVLVVVVLQFGRYDPSPPSLQENPNPAIPGMIAWWDTDNCIVVGAASGATRKQAYCPGGPATGGSPLDWVDAKTITYAEYAAPGPQRVTVNIETGEATRSGTATPDKPFGPYGTAPDGTFAATFEDGEIWVTENGQRHMVADFDTSKNHLPQVVSWSPDSRWMVLFYQKPRSGYEESEIWLLARDGSVAGTLTKDARGWGSVGWWIEGAGAWPK
ncbi:MAG TPA: hypothetical protein PKA49_10220 [Tepidiformaceae bacterium]|nr:hypothetical protein [Tepidiformaceae bacterium]